MALPFLEYKNLILHLSLTLSLSLILTLLKLPILFLQGLHTYIHPDTINPSSQNGIRAAIRRPSDSSSGDPSKQYPELKKRNKSKDKPEFDENNAQIFRLKLDESHLSTRLYFNAYRDVFNYFVLAMSCFLLYKYLDSSKEDHHVGFLNGAIITVVLGVLGVSKVFVSIGRVAFEKSASRRAEKELSVLIGLLGFVLGFLICFDYASYVFDFEFGSVDGFGRFCVAVLMGCFSGFLYLPAVKNARSFWIGTDQLRWNLGMISCGWFGKVLLYANYLLIMFTSLLWIDPFAKLLVKNNFSSSKEAHLNNGVGSTDELVGNMGMSRLDFTTFRILCLLISGIVQILVLRPSLQMYLNEAVLSWYQRLHASKVPDLDFSRAKVFLHNHYLCLVVLQFFAPPVLVLLFLGLSQIDGNSFGNFQLVCSLLPCSAFVKEVALCMAWWIVFVWMILTSTTLFLYRHGTLYVS